MLHERGIDIFLFVNLPILSLFNVQTSLIADFTLSLITQTARVKRLYSRSGLRLSLTFKFLVFCKRSNDIDLTP